MLELHTIHCGERSDWLAQCAWSVGVISHRIIDGRGRSIAENRARAIAESTAEYVGWVDPDDWIDSHYVADVLDALTARRDAVAAFTAEVEVDEAGDVLREPDLSPRPWSPVQQIVSPRYAHHLVIVRRAVAVRYLAGMHSHPMLPEYVLLGLMSQAGPLIRVPVPAYYWRQHAGQAHRRVTQDDRRRALQAVQRHLIAHTSGAQRLIANTAAAIHPAKCIACRAAARIGGFLGKA